MCSVVYVDARTSCSHETLLHHLFWRILLLNVTNTRAITYQKKNPNSNPRGTTKTKTRNVLGHWFCVSRNGVFFCQRVEKHCVFSLWRAMCCCFKISVQKQKNKNSENSKTERNMKRVWDMGFVFHEMVSFFCQHVEKHCVFWLWRAMCCCFEISVQKQKNQKVPKPKETWSVFGTWVLCFTKWCLFSVKVLKNIAYFGCGVQCVAVSKFLSKNKKKQKIRKFQNQKKHEACLGHGFCVSSNGTTTYDKLWKVRYHNLSSLIENYDKVWSVWEGVPEFFFSNFFFFFLKKKKKTFFNFFFFF